MSTETETKVKSSKLRVKSWTAFGVAVDITAAMKSNAADLRRYRRGTPCRRRVREHLFSQLQYRDHFMKMVAALILALSFQFSAFDCGAAAAAASGETPDATTVAKAFGITKALMSAPAELRARWLRARAAAASDRGLALRSLLAMRWPITDETRALLEVDAAGVLIERAEALLKDGRRQAGVRKRMPAALQFEITTALRDAEVALTLTRARGGRLPEVAAAVAAELARIGELRAAAAAK